MEKVCGGVGMPYIELPDFSGVRWFVDYEESDDRARDRISRARRRIAELDRRLQKQMWDNGW